MGSVTRPLSQVLNICYVADTLIYIHEDDGMIANRVQVPRKIANWAQKGHLHLYGNGMQFVDSHLMCKALLHLQHTFSSVHIGEGPSNISSTVGISAFFNMHSQTATYPNQESQKVDACRIKTKNCIGGSNFSRAGCCFSEISCECSAAKGLKELHLRFNGSKIHGDFKIQINQRSMRTSNNTKICYSGTLSQII